MIMAALLLALTLLPELLRSLHDFRSLVNGAVLVLVVLGVLIVATHPQWFLFLLFSAYVISGPTRPLWARRREPAGAVEREHGDSHDRERRI